MSLSTILMWGALGMLLTLPLRPLLRRGPQTRDRLAAIGLVLAAGIYLVSGWVSGSMAVELAGMMIFGGFALMALGHWPQLTLLGWLVHVGWDALALIGMTGHALAEWYPPLCAGFDLALVIMLVAAFNRNRESLVYLVTSIDTFSESGSG